MDWSTWHARFAHRADRALPPLPARIEVPEPMRAPLIRTLAVFLQGETGEGRIVGELQQRNPDGVDAHYFEALRLFVLEEGRHARILTRCIKALGGKPLGPTWAAAVFRGARRSLDPSHEVLVLLAAEVVALVFYEAVASGLPEGELREALHHIVGDEDLHLAFHVDFFRATLRSPADCAAFRVRWWAICGAACATVIVDHHQTFKALGVSRRGLLRKAWRIIGQVERRVLAPEREERCAAA